MRCADVLVTLGETYTLTVFAQNKSIRKCFRKYSIMKQRSRVPPCCFSQIKTYVGSCIRDDLEKSICYCKLEFVSIGKPKLN